LDFVVFLDSGEFASDKQRRGMGNRGILGVACIAGRLRWHNSRPSARRWLKREVRQVMRRTIAAFMSAGLLILGTGCASCGWVYAPFGPGTLCTGAPCDGCGVAGCTGCAAPAAVRAGAPACDDCGMACGGACAPCGPLTWLFRLLNCGFCGDGCGEMWWGDFHGAPPEACDPCNRRGDYTGRQGGVVIPKSGGCSSCGEGQTIDYTFRQTPRVLAQSPPSAAPSRAPVHQAVKPIPAVRR
jgi:hypothetical protein